MKKSAISFIMAIFLFAGSAHAFHSILNNFNDTYPASDSGANANCQLCHGASTNTFNEYGWRLVLTDENFAALENLPSMNINGGTTILDEINASTQPGWTTGLNNNLYNIHGLISSQESAPGSIGDLDPHPIADIKANGSDGTITIMRTDTLSVTIALNAVASTADADWWVLADTPIGWYRYDYGSKTWAPGMIATYQGPLTDIGLFEVLNMSALPTGNFTFYFGVDTVMNGGINMDQIYYDSVGVTVTQ